MALGFGPVSSSPLSSNPQEARISVLYNQSLNAVSAAIARISNIKLLLHMMLAMIGNQARIVKQVSMHVLLRAVAATNAVLLRTVSRVHLMAATVLAHAVLTIHGAHNLLLKAVTGCKGIIHKIPPMRSLHALAGSVGHVVKLVKKILFAR